MMNRSMVGTVQTMNVHICTLVFQDQQRVIQIQQLRDCLSDTLFQNAQLIAQIRDLKVQMAVVCKEKENVQHLCAELIALIDDVSVHHIFMCTWILIICCCIGLSSWSWNTERSENYSYVVWCVFSPTEQWGTPRYPEQATVHEAATHDMDTYGCACSP